MNWWILLKIKNPLLRGFSGGSGNRHFLDYLIIFSDVGRSWWYYDRSVYHPLVSAPSSSYEAWLRIVPIKEFSLNSSDFSINISIERGSIQPTSFLFNNKSLQVYYNIVSQCSEILSLIMWEPNLQTTWSQNYFGRALTCDPYNSFLFQGTYEEPRSCSLQLSSNNNSFSS